MLATSRGIIRATQSPTSSRKTTLPQTSFRISTSTHGIQTTLPQGPSMVSSIIKPTPSPTPELTFPNDKITLVSIIGSVSLLLLISAILFCILYYIAYTLKRRKKERYSQFLKDGNTHSDKDTDQNSDNSKYDPVYLTESFLDNEAQHSLIQETLFSLKPGIEVEATQDYFEPGRKGERPIFSKGDRIRIRRVEGDPRGETMVWLRGELDGREVCFPSYVIRLLADRFEDTFDTLSNRARRGSQFEQPHDATADSAPAELESIFHEVDANFDIRHLNDLPLSANKRYSLTEVSSDRKTKRPTRRPPRPPSNIETPPTHAQKLPRLPSKSNRPKLSFHEKGSKETDELMFVPPPLSSSTPVRKVPPKTRPKPTKGIRALIPLRTKGARPDTPDAKPGQRNKPKIVPRGLSWSSDISEQDLPPRPDPPFTPSTLSLILDSGATIDTPKKPPPPKIYETVEELKSVIASRSDSDKNKSET